MRAILLISLAIVFFSAPYVAFGKQSAMPYTDQCRHLATLTEGSPVFKYPVKGGFWNGGAGMMDAYLWSLRKPENNEKYDNKRQLETDIKSAIVMGAIVSNDLNLLKKYYAKDVSKYFSKRSLTILSLAVSCKFSSGIDYLLDFGVNTNRGKHIGAFNIALLRGKYFLAKKILDYGYDISENRRRCESSKYIKERMNGVIPEKLLDNIENAKCDSNP